MMIIPFLLFLLFILLVLSVVRGGVGFLRGGYGDRKRENPGEDARAILDGRYARGEISREEWERIRRDLG